MKTAREAYDEPQHDDSAKHMVCEECHMCITCGDCKRIGCGTER